jgi:MATE family multidrug resistance protein
MTFVDRMFLKWESGSAMAASFSASTLWFAVACLPLGICMYCATFVSQYFGNHQPERVGPAVWQGVWASLAFSPVLLLAIPAAPAIFAAAGHSSEIATLETIYFQILMVGSPALLISQALSAFYAGRGETSVVMKVDLVVVAVNLVLDYVWIFGKAGFAAMGIAGAGWATVVALWLKCGIYVLLVLQRKYRVRFGTYEGMRLDRPLLRRLLYYGAPSGLQILLDVAGFTAFILLVGRLGVVESEATSMAFSISTLAFMPIWGLGQAAGILVGMHLGDDRDDLAARATWTTYVVSLTYMAVVSLLYLLLPQLFLAVFFTGQIVSAHDQQVLDLAIVLLRFVAAYNLLDGTLMVFVSAIKGAGDTLFVLRVSLLMATALATLSWLGIEVLRVGIYGCWALITAWIWVLGTIFLLRFLQGRWRSMRVIEAAPVLSS